MDCHGQVQSHFITVYFWKRDSCSIYCFTVWFIVFRFICIVIFCCILILSLSTLRITSVLLTFISIYQLCIFCRICQLLCIFRIITIKSHGITELLKYISNQRDVLCKCRICDTYCWKYSCSCSQSQSCFVYCLKFLVRFCCSCGFLSGTSCWFLL